MPNSIPRPTSISSTATSGWRSATDAVAMWHEPGDFKPKLTSTTHSAVETGHRTRRQWGCLVPDIGLLPTLSVGLDSKGQTTRHRWQICSTHEGRSRVAAFHRLANIRLHLTARPERSSCAGRGELVSATLPSTGIRRSPAARRPFGLALALVTKIGCPRPEWTRGAAGEPEALAGLGESLCRNDRSTITMWSRTR
jgi:hypothetical protein